MYTNEHRYFIQFMLKNGCVDINKAKEFRRRLSEETSDSLTLQELILDINKKISKQELRIAVASCEISGVEKLILVNTSNDQISKLTGIFTPSELLYFQAILREILTTEDHKISEAICHSLAKSDNFSLKNDHAEEVLQKWTEMGYFVRSDGCFYLGCRCIAEFTSFFHQYYKDYLSNCNLCSEFVFAGKTCVSCDKRVHSQCLEKFVAKRKICPNCKKDWTEKNSSQSPVKNGIGIYESENSDDDINSNPGPSHRKDFKRQKH